MRAAKSCRPALHRARHRAYLAGDRDYAEEAIKSIGFVPAWQSGPDTNTCVRAALAVRPETKAFIADYIKSANK